MRNLLLGLALVLGVVVLVGGVRWGNAAAIAATQAEAAQLTAQRDSLLALVATFATTRDTLTRQRTATASLITTLRDSVAALEHGRNQVQQGVRHTRTAGALLDRFRATFPALGDSAARLTTLPFEPGDTLGLEYLMVPVWFAETFLIDHANAASWQAQRDGLHVVDSLHGTVAQLQDSITRLTQAERDAYRTGYDAAVQAYGALSTRHLAELRRPRVQVGSAFGFLFGAGTALAVVTLVR